MVDWITIKIPSTAKGLPRDHAIAPLGRPQRRRRLLGMLRGRHSPPRPSSRGQSPTVYGTRHQVEQRLQPPIPISSPPEISGPPPPAGLDEPPRRRLAVTAFAMGISTRQIEDLLRVLLPEDGPDHSTIARWVAEEARKAKDVLEGLDRACIPRGPDARGG